jgi:hypothetical protein
MSRRSGGSRGSGGGAGGAGGYEGMGRFGGSVSAGGAGSGFGYSTTPYTGLTARQFSHLSATQSGFAADRARVDTYSNPAWNVADRNWQEVLRKDPSYSWSGADQASWKKNCDFGPHNAHSQLDSILFKK